MRTRRTGVLAWSLGLGAAVVIAGCSTPGYQVPPPVAHLGDPERGKQQLVNYGCGSCHIIPGLNQANGLVGPPLIEWGQRSYIAGVLPNNAENLQHWIRQPQQVVPGNAMPDLGVTAVDARDMAAYLLSLGNGGLG